MTKETIIKSTLKYLVKRQIEEGSVGFAVDNDPDHDCCWYDILAWLEAQPTDITWVVGNDGAQVAFKNMPVDKAQQICAIIGDEAQSTDADSSEFDKGEISDGYHTFNQLYHQRAILFATIVNQNKDKAWKSFKHSDGHYCFDKNGEWFIVGVDTPQGSYTYHYSKEYWDMFECQELECGKEWDGHTEEDVIRLLSLEQQPKPMEKFDDIKTHIQRLAGDYKCWDNRLTWEEALELNRMLEAQPCEDCISRQAVLEGLASIAKAKAKSDAQKSMMGRCMFFVEHLPSVTPKGVTVTDFADKCRECGKIQNELSEDCISREAVRKILVEAKEYGSWDDSSQINRQDALDYVDMLPSVTPQRSKGKWIEVFVETPNDPYSYGFKSHKCSKCEYSPLQISNYCPNCGAEMEGEDEVGHD